MACGFGQLLGLYQLHFYLFAFDSGGPRRSIRSEDRELGLIPFPLFLHFIKPYKSPEGTVFQEDGKRDAGPYTRFLQEIDQLRILFLTLIADKGLLFQQGLDYLLYVVERDIQDARAGQAEIDRILRPFVDLGGTPYFFALIKMVLEEKDAAYHRRTSQDLDGFRDGRVEAGIDHQGEGCLRYGMQQMILFLEFFLRDLLIRNITRSTDQLDQLVFIRDGVDETFQPDIDTVLPQDAVADDNNAFHGALVRELRHLVRG